MADTNDEPLPVVIAGAGPCGLAAARTLQKSGVPFVLYERAAAAKLCANAGSGIDMAPTALGILDDELGVCLDGAMRPYEYMRLLDMDGKGLNTVRLKELGARGLVGGKRSFGFANRSGLQHAFLEALGLKDERGAIKDEADGILRCGVAVTSYEDHDGYVEVDLSDGTKTRGCALLACDGIHSAIRKRMCRDAEDPLSYCGQMCWWGKTIVEPGSDIDRELQRLAAEENMEDGNVSMMMLGTPAKPGMFFSCEVAEGVHAWAYFLESAAPAANASDDLTRRGGVALSGEEKRREVARLAADRPALMREIMEQTAGDDVTRAGLFDRVGSSLPYADGRVALLGDAAHPQSPMMGQGANMGIVDGYVAATRLAAALGASANGGEDFVVKALLAYDSDTRRKENDIVVEKARRYGSYFIGKGWFTCWAIRMCLRFMPASMLVSEGISGDKSNKMFVAAMKNDLEGQ